MMEYRPFICMLTNSTCYKNTRKMDIKGVLWHSTGADNPWIKRYVQPTEDNPDRAEILEKLGVNKNGNDWNHIEKQAGLNAFIGKFADGSVGTCQTMPWDYRPWGCGTRYKNGPTCNDGWIQFEICEDDLKDKDYAQAVWDEAVRFTAYIAELYGLDPLGVVPKKDYYGKMVDVPVILDHKTSWELGFGSGHGDIGHWFPKILGKDMEDARQEVAALMQKHEEGWEKTGGKWYFYKADGTMAKSEWVKYLNLWYYLGSDGAMLTGWQEINGKRYYLYADGHMASSEWVDGFWLNCNGPQIYPHQGAWKENEKGKWWEDASGWFPFSQDQRIDGKVYNFNSRGYLI